MLSRWPRLRLRWGPSAGLGLAAALAVVSALAHWQLSPLAAPLVQVSRPGPRALALYLAGRYAPAARAYRAGLRGPLETGYAADPAGYWALRAGDPASAEQRAWATLSLVPGAAAPLVTLGEIAIERGDLDRALALLREARVRAPDDPDVLYLEAVVLARAGEPGEAIDAMTRALRQRSVGRRETVLFRVLELAGDLGARAEPARPWCLLAHLHRYLRAFDERQGPVAMALARRAIAAGDRPADAWLVLGVVHDELGEPAAARQAFRAAVETDPHHADALWWLAGAARGAGDESVWGGGAAPAPAPGPEALSAARPRRVLITVLLRQQRWVEAAAHTYLYLRFHPRDHAFVHRVAAALRAARQDALALRVERAAAGARARG